MYFMSLCYVLAQYKVLGKGRILDFWPIVYILLSPTFGWAGIREEWASGLIHIAPHYDTWNLMYNKTAQGKIFQKNNLLLFNACHGKSIVSQIFLERTSLYMRDLENGGVGWATNDFE